MNAEWIQLSCWSHSAQHPVPAVRVLILSQCWSSASLPTSLLLPPSPQTLPAGMHWKNGTHRASELGLALTLTLSDTWFTFFSFGPRVPPGQLVTMRSHRIVMKLT